MSDINTGFLNSLKMIAFWALKMFFKFLFYKLIKCLLTYLKGLFVYVRFFFFFLRGVVIM